MNINEVTFQLKIQTKSNVLKINMYMDLDIKRHLPTQNNIIGYSNNL